MWISKEKWDALNKRIYDLEKKIPDASSSDPLTFTVYDPIALKSYASVCCWNYFERIPKQEVSVKAAIQKILTHLGIELTYVAGTPATVVMQKTKRPS